MRNFRVFFLFLILFADRMYGIGEGGPKKIVIFGAGYVGTVSGACLAKCGHQVTFIDPNTEKVTTINEKRSPISEPQLKELISTGIENGLIEAKCELGDEIVNADIAIICVTALTNENGTQQLEFLENVLDTLQDAVKKRKEPLVISIRSTILPKTYLQLRNKYQEGNPFLSLVVNPEFLRESTAVEDFFHPPFLVAGGDSLDAVNAVLDIFENVRSKKFAVSAETACMLKYTCNAFHALKIAFTNEVANTCEYLGINPAALMDIFREDKILNCSSSYLKPGFSFGGSCLSKDLQALLSICNSLEHPSPVLSSILPSNTIRFQHILNQVLLEKHRTLAVVGLSFKKNSDDLRESPFVDLVGSFLDEGISVRIFDSDLKPERLTHRNSKMDRLIPLIKEDINAVLDGCDAVVICKDMLDKFQIQQLRDANIKIYDLGYFHTQEQEAEDSIQ